MPPRDPSLRLQDIAEAIDRIFEYTASHSLDSFTADRMAVDAVVRNFEVIGEAARHVDAATAARLADIPWQDMRDLRNVLIHPFVNERFQVLQDLDLSAHDACVVSECQGDVSPES